MERSWFLFSHSISKWISSCFYGTFLFHRDQIVAKNYFLCLKKSYIKDYSFNDFSRSPRLGVYYRLKPSECHSEWAESLKDSILHRLCLLLGLDTEAYNKYGCFFLLMQILPSKIRGKVFTRPSFCNFYLYVDELGMVENRKVLYSGLAELIYWVMLSSLFMLGSRRKKSFVFGWFFFWFHSAFCLRKCRCVQCEYILD